MCTFQNDNAIFTFKLSSTQNLAPILYSFYLDCNHKGQLLGVMGYQCLSHKRVTEMIIQAALSSVTNLANEL